MATSRKLLEDLHEILIKDLLEKVRSGEATPAELNVARQLLKDNGIDAFVKTGGDLQKLADIVPFQDPSASIKKADAK